MSLDDIRNIRLEKLARLQEEFGSAFPIDAPYTHTIAEVLKDFTTLKKRTKPITIVGRIRALRGHGNSTFLDVEEDGARMQVYVKRDEVGDATYTTFIENNDVGDFFSFTGSVFVTKKKEKSLLAKKYQILAKSVRPLPDKWHGLQDNEERFRRRSLDLLMNDEARERFVVRSRLVRAIRDFLEGEEFMEVETPILQPLYGGALARPFTTHYNALDEDFYLRIAPELYLKRLLVGGFSRVFEIGKSFRNEGIDVSHSPEFTTIEAYAAFMGFEELLKLTEKMVIAVTKQAKGKAEITWDSKTIALKKPFKRLTFFDAIRRHAGITNIEECTEKELREEVKKLGITIGRADSRGKVLDEIFKKTARKQIMEPTFITNHPLDISPLAKESEQTPSTAERLQLIIAGQEVLNGYSELNNPVEQRKRFEGQEELAKKGDDEASRVDEDYIEVMEYGMPPAAGVGIGIDRMVQLLTDTHNIRDVILFPALRKKK